MSGSKRSGTEETSERQDKLAAWQAGLEKRDRAAEDLRERSRKLQEEERQVQLCIARSAVESRRLGGGEGFLILRCE